MEIAEAVLHGRRIAYRHGGDGPPTVLIHGITQDSRTWRRLAPTLTGHARLIAPDLPGHGRSQNPAGDHSLGAYASTVRDLLMALEEDKVTLVGHSLGGGVALQFAYQFPDMVDRLVLIDSGGLGRHVSPMLRAATLPGADLVLSLLTTDAVRNATESVSRGLSRLGLRVGTDLREAWRGLSGLADPDARVAFLRTVRATIRVGGQLVSARDKLYLAAHLPTLIIWGAEDRIIPLSHATVAHERIEGSRLKVIEGAGHFPHVDVPEVVSGLIADFLRTTEPADVPRERWGEIIRAAANGRAPDPAEV